MSAMLIHDAKGHLHIKVLRKLVQENSKSRAPGVTVPIFLIAETQEPKATSPGNLD